MPIPKAYIKDTVCSTSIYRVIGWKDYINTFNFYIDTTCNTMTVSMLNDEQDCIWMGVVTGPIDYLLKIMGIITVDLNGYIEPTLTYEGFIKVRDKALAIYDRSLKAQRMAFERGA